LIKGLLRNRLAAVNATTAAVLPWDPNGTGPIFPSVNDLSLLGGTLYFAGYFNQVKGSARNNLMDRKFGKATMTKPLRGIKSFSSGKDRRSYPNHDYQNR